MEADVLVVGAGPVGLTLAMDLASRGIRVTVAEVRRYAEPPNVKCNHVSARTMEQFRRLGVAQKVRDAGLPPDHPNDVAFRTSVCGTELSRIPIPCRRDRYTETEGPDTWWPTPEPPHRINQLFLEPILLEHTASLSGVTLLNRTRVTSFVQEAGGVSAKLQDIDGDTERQISCRYLVGCDGGNSTTRKLIGATLEGTAAIQRTQSSYIRAPRLKAMIPGKAAWGYYSFNPRRCGTVFSIDGRETWLIHNPLNADEPDFDSVNRDQAIRDILGVASDFRYEVISKEDWVGRRLLANKFREKNVFIAGDAAHLWVPYAGYGMNAGIADAINLSWLLAARLQGWAEESILDAYEAERRPITEQVSHFVMHVAEKVIASRRAVPPNIEAPGPEGSAVRANVARAVYETNVAQFCCAGLNFGYYYRDSPILADDDELPPPYSMAQFTASTVPGCRAPHFWLADGRSLYDALGQGYTLLRFDSGIEVHSLLSAAQARGMPLTVLDVRPEEAPDVYRHNFLMCRADQHVAWRGNAIPANPIGLVDRLCGAIPYTADKI